MYYLSPFTYLVEGMLATALSNTDVVCSSIEILTFNPPSGQTCSEYLNPYTAVRGGKLVLGTDNATQDCKFCSASETNAVLTGLSASYSHRWRNFAIMWAFIGFNICAALFLYWLARVPSKQKVLDEPPPEAASRVQSRSAKSEAKKNG